MPPSSNGKQIPPQHSLGSEHVSPSSLHSPLPVSVLPPPPPKFRQRFGNCPNMSGSCGSSHSPEQHSQSVLHSSPSFWHTKSASSHSGLPFFSQRSSPSGLCVHRSLQHSQSAPHSMPHTFKPPGLASTGPDVLHPPIGSHTLKPLGSSLQRPVQHSKSNSHGSNAGLQYTSGPHQPSSHCCVQQSPSCVHGSPAGRQKLSTRQPSV